MSSGIWWPFCFGLHVLSVKVHRLQCGSWWPGAVWTCQTQWVDLKKFCAREINTLRSKQNGCHFADDIFKYIFLSETFPISHKISLKFVPMGPVNIIPALVQIMAWHRPGDKPSSEPMMVRSLTHICVTRPQWVNTSGATTGLFQDNYVNIMAADALAPCVAKASAAMVLTMHKKNGPYLPRENFNHVSIPFLEMIENVNIFSYFLKWIYFYISWNKFSTTRC